MSYRNHVKMTAVAATAKNKVTLRRQDCYLSKRRTCLSRWAVRNADLNLLSMHCVLTVMSLLLASPVGLSVAYR